MLQRLRKIITPPNVEQRAALLAGKHITYTLKRSSKRRRSIGLHIDDRGLIVSVPMRASEKWLSSVLQDKAHWVVKKLEGWQASMPDTIRWQDGETIDYLGERLLLRVAQNLFDTPASLQDNELRVFVIDDNDVAVIELAVACWYRNEAERIFLQRVAHYAPLLNVAPRSVKLSEAKTQWGSCSAEGSIRLNLQMIKLPVRLIDYVVVHELAHLRELNHSSSFWRLVGSACPEYASLRAELKAVHIK